MRVKTKARARKTKTTAQMWTNNQYNNNVVTSQTQQTKTNTNLQCCDALTRKDDDGNQDATVTLKWEEKQR